MTKISKFHFFCGNRSFISKCMFEADLNEWLGYTHIRYSCTLLMYDAHVRGSQLSDTFITLKERITVIRVRCLTVPESIKMIQSFMSGAVMIYLCILKRTSVGYVMKAPLDDERGSDNERISFMKIINPLPVPLPAVPTTSYTACSSHYPLHCLQFPLPVTLPAVPTTRYIAFCSHNPLHCLQSLLPVTLPAVPTTRYIACSSHYPLHCLQYPLPVALPAVPTARCTASSSHNPIKLPAVPKTRLSAVPTT